MTTPQPRRITPTDYHADPTEADLILERFDINPETVTEIRIWTTKIEVDLRDPDDTIRTTFLNP